MPFYEYQCGACGHHHEALQKVSDPPIRKCPSCGKPKMRKLMSAPVFRLKGSGWYETDFKSDQENKRNLAVEKDEAPKKDDSATDSAKKDDAKPEAAKTDGGKTEAAKPVADKAPVDKSKAGAPAKRAPRAKPARRTARKSRR